MKKILLMLFMLFSVNSFAGNGLEEEISPRDILLKKEGSKDYSSERPRTLIPFTCVYADGIVQLILLGEVGEYTLTVSNQTSGECWSAENILLLQTSTASGTYQVEIEVEDGTVYYGTYTL